MKTIVSGSVGRSHRRRGPVEAVRGRVDPTAFAAPTTEPAARFYPVSAAHRRARSGVAAWVFALALAGGIGGAALAQTASETGEPARIGVVSLVNPDATLDRAAAVMEPAIGDDILLADRLATDTAGQVHLMLLDKSSFTVGPNSDVTIDRFVYDPETRSGEMAMSAVRGVMRFVGGDLSKDQPVEIRTAIGTLGIRGGILMLDIREDGGITAIFGYGVELTVETAAGGGAFESITRAGYMVEIAPDGTIGNPVPAPEETVRGIMQNLEAPTPRPTSAPDGSGVPEGPVDTGDAPNTDTPSGGGTAGGTGGGGIIGGGSDADGDAGTGSAGIGTQLAQSVSGSGGGLGGGLSGGFVLGGRPITIDSFVETDDGLLASVDGDLVDVDEIIADTIDQVVADAVQADAALESVVEEMVVAEIVPQLLAQFRFLIFDKPGIPADKVWVEVTDGVTSIVLNGGGPFQPDSSPEFDDALDLSLDNEPEYFVYDDTFQEGDIDFNFFLKNASSGADPYVGVEMVSDIDTITDNSTQGPNTLGDLTGANQDQIDTDTPGVTACTTLTGCTAFGTITVNATNP